MFFVRFLRVWMRRGKGGGYREPACFNVLNPEGASGTYQVETRIPCAVFLSAFIHYLKNQYRDLETLAGWASEEPPQIIYFKKHLFWGKRVSDTACTVHALARRREPDCVCAASQACINNVKEYLRKKKKKHLKHVSPTVHITASEKMHEKNSEHM